MKQFTSISSSPWRSFATSAGRFGKLFLSAFLGLIVAQWFAAYVSAQATGIPSAGNPAREIQPAGATLPASVPTEKSVTDSLSHLRHSVLKPTLEMQEPSIEVFSQLKKVVRWAGPSVVHIEAKKYSKTEPRFYTGSKEDSRGVEIDEAGAGVIFSHNDKFYVLTNRHVVEGAKPDNVFVQLSDGTFYYPDEMWDDPKTDLAVLGLKADQLPEAQFGNSDIVTVGDFVVAIGSPFGLNHSVSYGIISATGRRNLDLGKSGVVYQDFFQTDAAINPGNSGGPLINLNGQVVAVNTAIASNSGGNDGIGFAIPIGMAMKVATDLIDHGTVQRSFLGVTLDSQYDARVAASLGLNTVYGARVLRVGSATPASSAGLQVGDVILHFADKQVKSDSHLVLEVSQAPTDVPLPITVFRNGRSYDLKVTLVGNSSDQ